MKRFATRLLLLALPVFAVSPAWAQGQEMLSNLQIVGTVRATGDAPAAKTGDTVKAIEDKENGAVAATGSVLDESGTFYIEMNKQASYNGTPLRFEIVTGGKDFALKEGKGDAHLVFKGGFPFPKREDKAFYYGDGSEPTTAKAPAAASATAPAASTSSQTCPATLPKCDANGDGTFSQADIDIVKAELKTKSPNPKADLNGDGQVNSTDLITAVKELKKKK